MGAYLTPGWAWAYPGSTPTTSISHSRSEHVRNARDGDHHAGVIPAHVTSTTGILPA